MTVGSAQDGFYACSEFARAERFYEVVIAADLKADDAVDFAGSRGEEDDRDVGFCADGFAELEAATIGQADIENDEGKITDQEGG